MLTATRFTDLSAQMTGRVVIPSDPERRPRGRHDRARDGSELAIHAMRSVPAIGACCPGLTMAKKKTYGKTASGKPITDELVDGLADKAEAGYDVDETLRRRGGRPPIGSAAASVESVRLDPELRQALTKRAERDRETPSSVIRKALRKYLQVG
jgi:hypothetical protein